MGKKTTRIRESNIVFCGSFLGHRRGPSKKMAVARKKSHQCHVENDKRGADVIIELNGEKPVMVDLKTREKDFSYGRRDDIDVVIELTYGNKPGWATKETLADYYLFVCKDTGRSACFPAPELRQATVRHSEAWASTFKQLATITGGQYSNVVSHAVVVPANVVAQAIQLCDEGA